MSIHKWARIIISRFISDRINWTEYFARKTCSRLFLVDFISTRFLNIVLVRLFPYDFDGFTVKLVAIYINWVELKVFLSCSCSCRAWLWESIHENRDKVAVVKPARPCSPAWPMGDVTVRLAQTIFNAPLKLSMSDEFMLREIVESDLKKFKLIFNPFANFFCSNVSFSSRSSFDERRNRFLISRLLCLRRRLDSPVIECESQQKKRYWSMR